MRPDPDFERLVTERLLLRRSCPEDAEGISTYRSDPSVHRHQGWERTDPEGIRTEVEEHEGGRLVGDVGLCNVDGEPGVVKVGYTIAPAFQGRGYATEAVGALVDYAFAVLGADVVRAHASAENEPSLRVAEKVGMRLVERIEHRDGDEVWHGTRYERRREDLAGPIA